MDAKTKTKALVDDKIGNKETADEKVVAGKVAADEKVADNKGVDIEVVGE